MPQPKELSFQEIGKGLDDINDSIADTKRRIACHESDLRNLKYTVLANEEKTRAYLLSKFATKSGLVKTRKAPTPNSIVAEGDPLTEEELKQIDQAIEDAAAPEPRPEPTEDTPF